MPTVDYPMLVYQRAPVPIHVHLLRADHAPDYQLHMNINEIQRYFRFVRLNFNINAHKILNSTQKSTNNIQYLFARSEAFFQ